MSAEPESMPATLRGWLPPGLRPVELSGFPLFIPFSRRAEAWAPQACAPIETSYIVLPQGARSPWVSRSVYEKRMTEEIWSGVRHRSMLPAYCMAWLQSYEGCSEATACRQVEYWLGAEQCANNALLFMSCGARRRRVVAGCSTFADIGGRREQVQVVALLPYRSAELMERMQSLELGRSPEALREKYFLPWCRVLCELALAEPEVPHRRVRNDNPIAAYHAYRSYLQHCHDVVMDYAAVGSPREMANLLQQLSRLKKDYGKKS